MKRKVCHFIVFRYMFLEKKSEKVRFKTNTYQNEGIHGQINK